MSDGKDPNFDPYYKWLGIPKSHRPPTHYQLLGLVQGETDTEVIDEAAIRQSTHLRSYQLGPFAADCTRMLNEIAQAKQVLLNPQKKKAYDQQLASRAAAEAPRAEAPRPEASPSPIQTRPPVRSRVDKDDEDDDDDVRPRKKKKKRRPESIWTPGLIAGVAAGGVLAVAVVVGLIVFAMSSRPAPANQVAKNDPRPVVPPVVPVKPPVVPVVDPVKPPVKQPANPPVNPPMKQPVVPPLKQPGGDPGLDFEGAINLLDFRHPSGFWEATDPNDPTLSYQLFYRNFRATSNHFRLTYLKNGKVVGYGAYANLAEVDGGVSLDWVHDLDVNPAMVKSVPAKLTFEWDRLVERRPDGLVRKYKRADTSRYNFIGSGLSGALENAKVDMHINSPHDPIGKCHVALVDKKGSAWLSGVAYGDSMRFDIQFEGDLGAPWDKFRRMVVSPAPPMATCEFSGPGVASLTVPVKRSNGQPMFPEAKPQPKRPDHRGNPGFPNLAGYWEGVDANDPTIGFQVYYRHPPNEKCQFWMSYLRNGKATGFAVSSGEYFMYPDGQGGEEVRFNWSHHKLPDFGVQGYVPSRFRNDKNALAEHPHNGPPRTLKHMTDFEPYRPFWGKWRAKRDGDSLELVLKPGNQPGEPFSGSLTIKSAAGQETTVPTNGLRPYGTDLLFDAPADMSRLGEPWDCFRDVIVRRHGDDLAVDFVSREGMILRVRFKK